MNFDDDQIDWIRLILRRAGVFNVEECAATLASAISSSIAVFTAERAAADTFRTSHDDLHAIWALVVSTDPPIGLIRTRLLSLPAPARSHLERRAERLWPTLFGRSYSKADLEAWIRNADREVFLARLPHLLAEGAAVTVGRNRPSGRPSARRFEPIIMGVSRGRASAGGHGRPRRQPADNLVMYLAVDWLVVTGQTPATGRSEAKPFGELVHRVFDWLNLSGADQALRRYWAAVAREKARATPFDRQRTRIKAADPCSHRL